MLLLPLSFDVVHVSGLPFERSALTTQSRSVAAPPPRYWKHSLKCAAIYSLRVESEGFTGPWSMSAKGLGLCEARLYWIRGLPQDGRFMKSSGDPSRPSRYDFLPRPARSRMPIIRNFLEPGDEMRCKKPAEGDADTPKANVSGHSGRVRKPSRLRSGDRQRRSAPGLPLSPSGSCWMPSAPGESTAASSFRGSMNEKRRVERPPVQVDRSQGMRR